MQYNYSYAKIHMHGKITEKRYYMTASKYYNYE